MDQVQVVFFDIGDTLATAQLTLDGRLASLEPLAGVRDGLARLRHAGLCLGIISNTGVETSGTMRQALTGAGLYAFFEPALLIYSSDVGMKKDSPKIFQLACKWAGLAKKPGRCMFVGEAVAERQFAFQAGLRVAASVEAVVEAFSP